MKRGGAHVSPPGTCTWLCANRHRRIESMKPPKQSPVSARARYTDSRIIASSRRRVWRDAATRDDPRRSRRGAANVRAPRRPNADAPLRNSPNGRRLREGPREGPRGPIPASWGSSNARAPRRPWPPQRSRPRLLDKRFRRAMPLQQLAWGTLAWAPALRPRSRCTGRSGGCSGGCLPRRAACRGRAPGLSRRGIWGQKKGAP